MGRSKGSKNKYVKYLKYVSKMIKLYNSGLSILIISKKLNIPESSVYKYLKINNIKIRPLPHNKKYSNKKIKNIIKLYNEGLNCKYISKILKIKSPSTVRHYLKKNKIKIRGNECYSKYKFNEKFLNSIKEEQAWFLGIMASDGFVIKNKKYFSIAQSGLNGLKMIKYIKRILGANCKIYVHKTYRQNSYQLQLTSPYFVKKLLKYNILNNKSLIYEFPNKLSLKYIRDFIRGYLEGDGCITISKGGIKGYKTKYLCVSFVGTKNFIKECIKYIPFKTTIREIKYAKNCFEARWNGERALDFCKWLYSTPNLYKGSKYNNYISFKKNYNPVYKIYAPIKKRFFKLYKTNKSIMNISKIMNIPFQTLYEWRNKFL
jgi:hypothetical protein